VGGENSLIETKWYVLRTGGPDVIICIYCYNRHYYYYYYYYYYYCYHRQQQKSKPLNTGSRYNPPAKRSNVQS